MSTLNTLYKSHTVKLQGQVWLYMGFGEVFFFGGGFKKTISADNKEYKFILDSLLHIESDH